MAKTIQQLLAAPNMLGIIQSVKTGVPNPYDPALMSTVKQVTGDYGTYNKVEGTRQTARLVQYGSASVRRAQKGLTQMNVKLIHSFEHQFHNPIVLQNLMELDRPDVQQMGMAEIGRQSAEFKVLFDNLRVSALSSAFALGCIYFDGDGNLLPSSAGAVITIDFGIPAGNKDQVGGLVDTKWETTTANIPAQIDAIMAYALRQTGYPLTTAYYGSSIFKWLLANDYVQKLMASNNALQNSLLQHVIPDGFLRLKWRPAASSFFVDQDGTSQTIFPADAVTLTPDVTLDWYEMLEGTYLVPTNVGNISGNAVQATQQNVMIAKGMFSYAQVLSDPVTVKQMAGDTFLPVIKVPGAVFVLDVDF